MKSENVNKFLIPGGEIVSCFVNVTLVSLFSEPSLYSTVTRMAIRWMFVKRMFLRYRKLFVLRKKWKTATIYKKYSFKPLKLSLHARERWDDWIFNPESEPVNMIKNENARCLKSAASCRSWITLLSLWHFNWPLEAKAISSCHKDVKKLSKTNQKLS